MAEISQTVSVAELQKFPMFRDLALTEIVAFLKSARVRSFNANSPVVFRQNDPGDGMYIILSGEIDVYTADSVARRHLLGTLGEGDFLGEMSLVEQKPRAASAEARGDARLIFLASEAFLKMRETDAAAMNKILLRMMAEMSARLRVLGSRYVSSKAALGGF